MYTSMSNAAVFKHCRVSDAETELRVRRLRWMQKVVAEPTNHRQAIAGIFGRCRMDDSEALDKEGRLTAEANSYAVRWMKDVETRSGIDGGDQLLDEIDGRPMHMFRECIAGDLNRMDFREIHARAYSSAIPLQEEDSTDTDTEAYDKIQQCKEMGWE